MVWKEGYGPQNVEASYLRSGDRAWFDNSSGMFTAERIARMRPVPEPWPPTS